MSVINITADLAKVDFFPATELEEIMQNVKTILTTAKGEARLDRDFGLDVSMLDNPTPHAISQLTRQIVEAIETYEPRAKVLNVTFDGNGEEGELLPTVQVVINE